VKYEAELAFAKKLATQCGAIMRDLFTAGLAREWKEDGTPLTVADTRINALVIESVRQAFPEHGVLGEEESSNIGAQMLWVCDPVDGTMPFSHGLPISTFSLALVEDGVPRLGVVYDPFMDRLFWAAQGRGAFLNGKRLQVSGQATLQNALIDTEGFPSVSPVLPLTKAFEGVLHAQGAKTVSLWSAILPTALIAAGQFTAALFNVNKPEDPAAVKVIVEEAGGKVTDLFGNEQRYDGKTKGYIASNGHVHGQLVDLIRQHGV
jgi:fructose-1,6-bisphosphatase/inositol monophosphatase family enzyme